MLIMTMPKTTVAVLVISLWTISSPVLAAIRSGDCSGDVNFCTDDTDGDANSVCVGNACECKPAFKLDTNCVEKGLGDTCAATTDCEDVTNAVCPAPITSGSVCTCDTLYKKVGDACVKLLGSTCSAAADCSGLNHGTCDTNCKCSTGYKANTAATDCVQVYDMDCSADGDCNVATGAQHVCTASKCACAATYAVKENVCVLKLTEIACTEADEATTCPVNAECTVKKCTCKSGFSEDVDTCVVQNGASGMTSRVGMLCALLMLLSYLTKY